MCLLLCFLSHLVSQMHNVHCCHYLILNFVYIHPFRIMRGGTKCSHDVIFHKCHQLMKKHTTIHGWNWSKPCHSRRPKMDINTKVIGINLIHSIAKATHVTSENFPFIWMQAKNFQKEITWRSWLKRPLAMMLRGKHI